MSDAPYCHQDWLLYVLYFTVPLTTAQDMSSSSDVLEPRGVHDTPAEARRDRGEAALLDLGEEHLVLVRELLVVLADLANDAV